MMFQLVEPFQGSLISSTITQGGAASPLTLGYDVQPLRGIHLTASLLVRPNMKLPREVAKHRANRGHGLLSKWLMACLAVALGSCLAVAGYAQPFDFSQYNPENFSRPYGVGAAWNVSIEQLTNTLGAGGLVAPNSAALSQLMWEGTTTPGNTPGISITTTDYTYPVYDVGDATGMFRVEIGLPGANLDGQMMPWNPSWEPATGTDAQAIVVDPDTGREWNLFQVDFDGTTISATNGNLVMETERTNSIDGYGNPVYQVTGQVADYRVYEEGFPPSRGVGIPYQAMLVRPEEIMRGKISHALSLALRNTDGTKFVAPATKLEWPGNPPGVPEGTRFALSVTDAQIDTWIAGLPASFSEVTKYSARVIAEALRDYGWIITDTNGGGSAFQFESVKSAGNKWDAVGLPATGLERYMLYSLIDSNDIYAVVPSDQYKPETLAGTMFAVDTYGSGVDPGAGEYVSGVPLSPFVGGTPQDPVAIGFKELGGGSNPWVGNTNDVTSASGGLVYVPSIAGRQFGGTGAGEGHVEHSAQPRSVSRDITDPELLQTGSEPEYWASALIRPGDATQRGALYFETSNGGVFGFGFDLDQFIVFGGAGSLDESSTGIAVDGETFLLVMRVDTNNRRASASETVTLWVNPDDTTSLAGLDGTSDATTEFASSSFAYLGTTVTGFGSVTYGFGASMAYDEVRLGTTLNSVSGLLFDLPGDFDSNEIVDGDDLHEWQTTFGLSVVPGTGADDSLDGLVDGSDFLSWQRNIDWGLGTGGSPASASVPEPCTLRLVLLMGLVFGMAWERRR